MKSIELPDGLTAARTARRALGHYLEGSTEHDRAVAVLLADELVNNAVQHGQGPVVLDAAMVADGLLRVSVSDEGECRPRRADPSVRDERGRGLVLLERLAASWGVLEGGATKTVWFELALADDGEAIGDTRDREHAPEQGRG